MDKQQIEPLLLAKFPKKHISATLSHFSETAAEFQAGNWERCIAKAGKFVEAALKALGVHTSIPVPSGRQFKADSIMTGLGQLPGASFEDTVRLTIPRACRFIYDVASNRGARHDPDEVNPNEMDANAVVPICSWILAEMIRYAQKGALDPAQTKELVEALSARRYPLIEVVDGRVYFHQSAKSAPDVAVLALAHRYPRRVSHDDLVSTIERHGFTRNNAKVALARVRRLVDDDGTGNLRLLAPGLKKAEWLMRKPRP